MSWYLANDLIAQPEAQQNRCKTATARCSSVAGCCKGKVRGNFTQAVAIVCSGSFSPGVEPADDACLVQASGLSTLAVNGYQCQIRNPRFA
eukprot:scaffold2359_cov109-Skeletonema_marinoi.AAC.1